MKIVIAGAGAVGTHLARLLSKDNLDIVLIDESEERIAKLNNELDIMTLVQSPSSIKGLKRAGIEKTDLFIAVTPDESENLVCCMLDKKVVARKLGAKCKGDKTCIWVPKDIVTNLVGPNKSWEPKTPA